MSKDEIILPYKLEQHLVEICNSNATYANLLSVWNINKKMCQDVLSTVVMNYPHYTKHDISHCEAIITNIEMLLGEEAIKALSPTDTWLLLHAAYLHDIGMVIECKKIEKNWCIFCGGGATQSPGIEPWNPLSRATRPMVGAMTRVVAPSRMI